MGALTSSCPFPRCSRLRRIRTFSSLLNFFLFGTLLIQFCAYRPRGHRPGSRRVPDRLPRSNGSVRTTLIMIALTSAPLFPHRLPKSESDFPDIINSLISSKSNSRASYILQDDLVHLPQRRAALGGHRHAADHQPLNVLNPSQYIMTRFWLDMVGEATGYPLALLPAPGRNSSSLAQASNDDDPIEPAKWRV